MRPILLAACLALCAAAHAEAKLRRYRTAHYSLQTDLGSAHVRELKAFLEAMHRSFSQTFTQPPLRRERPQVLVFRDVEDFRAYAHRRGMSPHARGVFMRSDMVLVSYLGDGLRDLFSILSHEGLHQFMWAHGVPEGGRSYPLWFGEGLAEWFRASEVRRGYLIQRPLLHHVRRLAAHLEAGTLWSLDRLLATDPSDAESEAEFEAFYAHAYLLMDLLATRQPEVIKRVYHLKRAGTSNAAIERRLLGSQSARRRLSEAFVAHVRAKVRALDDE